MFLESLGNFLTGRGWQSNAARNEEDRKKKRNTGEQNPSIVRPTAPQSPGLQMPTALTLPTKPQQTQTLKPQTVKTEKPKQNTQAPQSVIDRLSVGPKATADFARMIAGGIFGGITDTGSRVIETVDQANTAVNRWKRDVAGASEEEKWLSNYLDNKRFEGYEAFRQGASDITNKIAGRDWNIKEETDREAANISSGKATLGEVFSAALKSVDLAGIIPLSRVSVQGGRAAGDAFETAIRNFEKNLGRRLTDSERLLVSDELISQAGAATAKAEGKAGQTLFEQATPTRPQTPEVLTPNEPFRPTPTRPGVQTQTALGTIETKLKNPLTPDETAEIVNGGVPTRVVDEAASIGDGISTPSTVAKAEGDVANVARVAKAETTPMEQAIDPNLLEAPKPVRTPLNEQIANFFAGFPSGRELQRGSIQFPGKRLPGKRAAGDLDIGPTAEDLAKIESRVPNDVDDLTPQNLDAEFLRDDIKRLDELARKREAAGASDSALEPIYAQIDAKTAELERMFKPQKVTKAQEKAIVQNERVAEAQRALEEAVGAKPAKASKPTTQLPTKPATASRAETKAKKYLDGKLPEGADKTAVKAEFERFVNNGPADETYKYTTKERTALGEEFRRRMEAAPEPKPVKDAPAAKPATGINEKGSRTNAERKFEAPAKGAATELPTKPAKATTKPVKATTKREQIKAEKTKALNIEKTKAAAKEQAKVLKKVDKAVNKAEGKTTTTKAAPKLAKQLAREYADGSDLSRTMESLGAKRGATNQTNEALKAIKRVSKQSDDEVIASANRVDLGLKNASDEQKVFHVTQGLVPRLARMRKVAEAAGDVEKTKQLTTAFDNVMKQLTSSSSKAGSTNSAVAYAYKNAGPDLSHALTKKKFEDIGGKIDPEVDSIFRESYEDVYTAQKQLDTANDLQAGLMEKLKKSKKGLNDKDIADLKAQKKRAEGTLENALAENERLASEIYEKNVKAGNIVDDKGVGGFGPAYEGWRKALMLSAPTGRLRDLAATTNAAIDKIAVDTVESALGKLSGAKGVRTSMEINSKAVAEGFKEGWDNVKKIASGDKKGGIYVDAGPEGLARKYKGAKTDLSPAPKKANKFVRVVNAASAAPTELFRGYRANRLRQYADVAGRAQGLRGAKLKQFKDLYEINPPKAIDDMVENDFLLPSSMHKNWVYDAIDGFDSMIRSKAAGIKDPKKRKAADLMVRELGLLTMPFKKFAAGSLHRMMTDQNLAHNIYGTAKGLIKGSKQDAITHASKGLVNTAKLGLASAVVMPFLSETDANGDSYNPPYVKVGDDFIPLQSFGPVVAASVGGVWANKKFMDTISETGNPAQAVANWAFSYGQVMLQSTGMDGLAAGDSPAVRALTGLSASANGQEGADVLNRVSGRFIQDNITQWIPAASRDANSVVDWMIERFGSGNQYAPDTTVKDADGKKDYVLSGLKTSAAAIVGVRQIMASANPGEKANPTPVTRFLGATRQSDAAKQNAENKATKESIAKAKVEATTSRISKFTANEKIAGVLDDETRLLYDRAKAGDKKLTQTELDSIESGVKKGEQKLLQSDDYDTYLVAVETRREKLANDPATAKKDLANIDFDINVAKTLKANEVPYDVYNMYSGSSKSGNDAGVKAGISNGELEDMLDPESPYRNAELAQKLLTIDKIMTDAGLSDNSLNSKVMKYAKAMAGGSGGKGKDKVITDIGSISKKTLNAGGPTLQYRDLERFNSPIPNLSKATAKTNFKKNITVKRGVAL